MDTDTNSDTNKATFCLESILPNSPYGTVLRTYGIFKIYLLFQMLKELSHEIEMDCRWYEWIEPYPEMNL